MLVQSEVSLLARRAGTKKSSWRMTCGGSFPAGKEVELAGE